MIKKIFLILFTFISIISSGNEKSLKNTITENKNAEINVDNLKFTDNKIIDNFQEAIILLIIDNNEIFLEGFLDSENNNLYFKKIEIIKFLEIPLNLQNKITNFLLEIHNEEYLNITSLNASNIYEFKEFIWDDLNSILLVNPAWETTFERNEKIKKNRLNLDKRNKIGDNGQQVNKEEWKLITPGLLTLGYTKENLKEKTDYLYFNYSNNLLYGNFNLTGELREEKFSIDNIYWQKDIINNKKLLIGEYYQSRNFSYGNSSKLKGISIGKTDSWNSTLSVTTQSIKGFAPSGITVELYENNILKDYQIVENGEYEFLVNLYNGSNEYILKKYLSDGSIEEKKISLYGNDEILEENNFDYIIEFGQNKENDNLYNLQLKYGLFKNLTLSLGMFNSLSENQNDQFVTLGEIGSFSIPYINLPVLHDFNIAYKDDSEYSYKYKITTNKYKVYLSYFYEDNKKINNSILGVNRLNNSDIQLSTTIFDWNSRIGFNTYKDFKNVKSDEMYTNFGKSFRKIYLNLGAREVVSENKNTTYLNLGASYSFDSKNSIYKYINNISFSSSISSHDRAFTLNIGKFIASSEWGYNLTVAHSENTGQSYGILVDYTPGKIVNLQSGIYISNNSIDRISSSVETNVYFIGNKPILGYDDSYGNGNIHGKTFIDKNGNNIFDDNDEYVDTKIYSEFNTNIFSKNGSYGAGGIQTYKAVEITAILNENAEVPYNIEPKINKKIQLNPGGQMNIDFVFKPKVTVASNIEFPSNFYLEDINNILKNIDIQFKNLLTEEIITFNWTGDTMFIQDLSVGKYEISLIYPKNNLFSFNKDKYILELQDENFVELYFKILNNRENEYILSIASNSFQLEKVTKDNI